jgi:oxygen-dependent protoporphyrinogen oxidase
MPRRIAILGAGISGLAIAWFLKRALGSCIHLTIIEKNPRVGGWIQTLQTEGFLFEQGPHSCRSKGNGQETLALIEALGLQDQILTPHSDARCRYLYQGQRLQSLPKHLWEVPLNPLTFGWLKALWRDWHMPKRQEEDESIQAFFTRRIGKSWTERLIDPFVSGIYAGNSARLSLKSCFPLFDQWEQQQGSLLRGAWRHRPSSTISHTPLTQKIGKSPMFSLREGMESLPRALARELKENFSLGQAVHHLYFKEQTIEIHLENGECLMADQVISTLPAFALSSVLAAYPLVADKLRELPYASVAIINIGFQQAVLPCKGFGYLIPSQLGLQVLGCVWDSCIFPQQNVQNQTRLTLIMGGIRHPEVEQMSEQEIKKQALLALHSQMGICTEPQVMQVKKAQHAIPQFEVGYSIWKQRVQEVMHYLSPHLILSGSAWNGVSINDCVAQARQLVQQIVNHLEMK